MSGISDRSNFLLLVVVGDSVMDLKLLTVKTLSPTVTLFLAK